MRKVDGVLGILRGVSYFYEGGLGLGFSVGG